MDQFDSSILLELAVENELVSNLVQLHRCSYFLLLPSFLSPFAAFGCFSPFSCFSPLPTFLSLGPEPG